MGLLVVMACASSGGGGPNSAGQRAEARHASYGNAGLETDGQFAGPVTWHDLSDSANVTWKFLPVAFSRLGLTITRYDSVTRTIDGERLSSRADFGGKPVASLLNCGEVAGVPNVTRYDVDIRIRTALRGSDSESSIATVVSAAAKIGGTASDSTLCGVSPDISARVTAAVAEAVAEATK